MERQGPDAIIAAFLLGVGGAASVLVSALLVSLLTKKYRTEVYPLVNRLIGSALMYLSCAALFTTGLMCLFVLLSVLVGRLRGAPVPEFAETPEAALLLGLCLAPFFKRWLARYVKSWTALAVLFTLAFTFTTLMMYPLQGNGPDVKFEKKPIPVSASPMMPMMPRRR